MPKTLWFCNIVDRTQVQQLNNNSQQRPTLPVSAKASSSGTITNDDLCCHTKAPVAVLLFRRVYDQCYNFQVAVLYPCCRSSSSSGQQASSSLPTERRQQSDHRRLYLAGPGRTGKTIAGCCWLLLLKKCREIRSEKNGSQHWILRQLTRRSKSNKQGIETMS